MALVLSIPSAIIQNEQMRHSMRSTGRKASSVTRLLLGTFMLSIFSGSTALGCSICLNSFLTILSSMTPLIHFSPPLVEPEQAPMNIHVASTTHVTCGHLPASSLKSPVVVMNDTTWNSPQRSAFSMS